MHKGNERTKDRLPCNYTTQRQAIKTLTQPFCQMNCSQFRDFSVAFWKQERALAIISTSNQEA